MSQQGLRVLVTGASGFIGVHTVRALRDAGHPVTALVRKTSDRSALDELDTQYAFGDLADPESIAPAVAVVDAVIHLASVLKVPWKPEFRTTNIGGTEALAAACVARTSPPVLVVVSSLAAGGPSPLEHPRSEADADAPVSKYGRMKRDCEGVALKLAGEIPITVVRPPMVFGAGDRWALDLFRTVGRGFHLVPTLRPAHLSLIASVDLARVLVRAVREGTRATVAEPARGLYYAAGAERPTYADLGRLIATAMGTAPPRVLRLPAAITAIAAASSEVVARLRDRPTILNLDKWREASAGSWICDASRAERELGLLCGPLAERLAETAAAYRTAGWLT